MTVKLLSYNIRKAVGLDRKRAPGRILDVINQSGADIVVLQETDKRLGARPAALKHRLIEHGSDYDVVPIAENEVSLGWHGNAMLLRRGLTLERIERLNLPGLEPRGAILAEITLPNAERMTIVGTHLGLLRPSRRRQLARIIESIAPPDRVRCIIAGDFNEWSDTKGLEALSESHRVISPGKSFHANLPLAALDKIAVGNAIEPVEAGIIQTKLASISSDHLPVWADISLPVSDHRPKPCETDKAFIS
ncbi:MAG: endonuclease/exonuclease/phosphatase family protein [Pseudomonadota bacterium]